MTDEEAAARGRRAEREFLELEAAFETVRDAIVDTLIATSVIHPDKILRLHAAAQGLTAVKQAMMNVVAHGQVAQHALDGTSLLRPN